MRPFALSAVLAVMVFLSACQTKAPSPSDQRLASATPEEDHPSATLEEVSPPAEPLALSWTMDTSEGTYGMPETVIYLNAGGFRFPIASGPGMQDMSAEQRERFQAPEGALAAAGYWAGFGVNLLVTQEAGEIQILEAIWDEGAPAAAAYDYTTLATISASDITALRDGTDAWVSWAGCFEAHDQVTTSNYDIIVENSQVTADVDLVIADDRNAYYTSATISGGGQQIGPYLFVEQYITIENDNQNDVAIWHLDDASNPQVLTVRGEAFPRCSTE